MADKDVKVDIFNNINVSIISKDDSLIIASINKFEINIITLTLSFRKLIYSASFSIFRKIYNLSLKALTFLRNIRVFII